MKVNRSEHLAASQENNSKNNDKLNKINRRKSVLHQVMENSLIEKDNDNDTSGQISEWMKLKS